MARVLVMGAYGLLGNELCSALTKAGHELLRQGRRKSAEFRIDPQDISEVKQLLEMVKPNIVINLVAATNVDECESNPQLAYLANVKVVDALVQAVRGAKTHLIQISTDQVYDGSGPHNENKVCPANVYALSKYSGEIIATSIGATVLRTNFVGKSRITDRISFTDWIVQSLREKKQITLFNDVLFSALHISDLCRFIEQAIHLRPKGTFNVGCKDGISKAQFALSLAKILVIDTSHISIGQLSDVKLNARRPQDMRLKVEKFEYVFNIEAPNMSDTLKMVAGDYYE